MEVFQLIKELAYPITILIVAMMFPKPIVDIVNTLLPAIKGLSLEEEQKRRNLRFKFGDFEIESKLDEKLDRKLQEKVEAIAEETDLQKRLLMAKEPLLIDDALKIIDEKETEILQKMYESRIETAFHLSWWDISKNKTEFEATHKLYKLGLIKGYPMYDGDDFAWTTPTGLSVLKKLDIIKNE